VQNPFSFFIVSFICWPLSILRRHHGFRYIHLYQWVGLASKHSTCYNDDRPNVAIGRLLTLGQRCRACWRYVLRKHRAACTIYHQTSTGRMRP
jgi:hypothetical protein